MNTYMLGIEATVVAFGTASFIASYKLFNGGDWSDKGLKFYFFLLGVMSIVALCLLVYIHYAVFHGPKSTLPW